jgi:hypothetical protein
LKRFEVFEGEVMGDGIVNFSLDGAGGFVDGEW